LAAIAAAVSMAIDVRTLMVSQVRKRFLTPKAATWEVGDRQN